MRYLAILFLAPLFLFDTPAFAQRFPAPRPAPIYRPPVTTRPNMPTTGRTNLPPINRPPKFPPRTQPATTRAGQKSTPARTGNTNVVPLRTVAVPQRTSPVVASARASNTAKLAQLRSALANRKKTPVTAGGGGRKPPGGGGGNVAANDNEPPRGFKVEGQLAKIFADRRLFQNWLNGNQSLSRKKNPLNITEAQQIIDNSDRLGIPINSNLNGLRGLEKTGQWAKVPHFKIGNVHIPIQKGIADKLRFPKNE